MLSDFLARIDILWHRLNGFELDFDQTEQYFSHHKLFSNIGFMKVRPSRIPGTDLELKRIAKKYGGWSTLMTNEFHPPSELYKELELAGITLDNFERARIFLRNPNEYAKWVAVKKTKESIEKNPKVVEFLRKEENDT